MQRAIQRRGHLTQPTTQPTTHPKPESEPETQINANSDPSSDQRDEFLLVPIPGKPGKFRSAKNIPGFTNVSGDLCVIGRKKTSI